MTGTSLRKIKFDDAIEDSYQSRSLSVVLAANGSLPREILNKILDEAIIFMEEEIRDKEIELEALMKN